MSDKTKMSRWFGHLALILLIIASGGWILHVQQQRNIERQPLLAELLRIAPTEVTTITLRQARQEPQEAITIVLALQQGVWFVTSPFEAPAERRAAERVMDVLYRPSMARYPADEINRAAARLDSPPLQVTFNDQTIAFGTTDPIMHRRYCQIGDEVHLLIDDFTHHLTLAPENFRAQQQTVHQVDP